MVKTDDIQSWIALDKPLAVNRDASKSKFKVFAAESNPLEDKDLDARITDNWESHVAEREKAPDKPKLVDNQTIYLDEAPAVSDQGVVVHTHMRPFRYTHAFNRTPKFEGSFADLKKHRLIHVSNMTHILTSDGYVLHAEKSNQYKQISSFGGFANIGNEAVQTDAGNQWDVHNALVANLVEEMGKKLEVDKRIQGIELAGQTYLNELRLRGTQFDYVVHIDAKKDEIVEMFEPSKQFSGEFSAVKFSPDAWMKFVEEVHKKDRVMSPYCMGSISNVIHANFGKEAAEKMRDTIRAHAGKTISGSNDTDYYV